jgi:hypothetical protein
MILISMATKGPFLEVTFFKLPLGLISHSVLGAPHCFGAFDFLTCFLRLEVSTTLLCNGS